MHELYFKLSEFQEIAPLCEKRHVMLVKNKSDGRLYVKKDLEHCNVEVFRQLQERRVDNTPEIQGIWMDEKGVTVVEEYLTGRTIAEIIEQEGFFTEKETVNIVLQLCKIVKDLHSQSPAIIHRDIKPSNIIISPEGKVKLLDFNAAKLMTSGSRDTVLLGTEGYAAPEQYGFTASSCQTDIYTIGVLINVCLNGRLPLQGTVSGALGRIIRRCTAIDPKDRYHNIRELAKALQHAGSTRVEWLPPGFRTLKPYKMIPALLGYILYALILLTLDPPTNGDIRIVQISLAYFGAAQIIFCCNYMGLRRYFPCMRSSKAWLRALGYALSPVINFMSGIIIAALFDIFWN